MSSPAFLQPWMVSHLLPPEIFCFESTFQAAKKDMEEVCVPMRRVDIFDRKKIGSIKALFSDEYRRDPTPGISFSRLSDSVTHTLNGYWVDKHLSSRVSIDFMEEIVKRIEQAVHNQLHGGSGRIEPPLSRDFLYIRVINDFGGTDDPYVDSRKKVNPEISFMFRLIDRLCLEFQREVYNQMPPLQLPKNIITTPILRDLRETFTSADREPMYHATSLMDVPGAIEAYEQFCKQLYDIRDARLVKTLRERLEKDKLARAVDPRAPLIHIVTLESYEREIAANRKKLYLIAATVVVKCLSVFTCMLRTRARTNIEKKVLQCFESIHRVLTWRPQRRLSIYQLFRHQRLEWVR